MLHAMAKLNGRVVDLCEPRILGAVMVAVDLLREVEKSTDVDETRKRAGDAANDLADLYAFHEGQDPGDINPIPDAEPVFLLRGQDIVAAPVVRAWVAKYMGHPERDPGLVNGALAHADAMANWPVKKVADA